MNMLLLFLFLPRTEEREKGYLSGGKNDVSKNKKKNDDFLANLRTKTSKIMEQINKNRKNSEAVGGEKFFSSMAQFFFLMCALFIHCHPTHQSVATMMGIAFRCRRRIHHEV